MNNIIDIFVNMDWAEELFVVGTLFIGIIIGYVVRIIQKWKQQREFDKVEKQTAEWLKHHSLQNIAKLCHNGEMKLDYPVRCLVHKIHNAIETTDDEDEWQDAMDKNENLCECLMEIAYFNKGEKIP